MSRPSILLPGDVLLYKGKDWLGKGIDWAEWVDGHEATAYCHAALFYGPRDGQPGLWIVRQNPGGPAFELADSQPWDNINTFRLQIQGAFVGNLNQWVEQFKLKVENHFQDGYAYLEIKDYLDEDLIARLGQMKLSEDLRRKAAMFLDAHKNCCSEFDRIVLSEATNACMNRAGPVLYDLLPALGPGQARPADLPNSPDLALV